MNHLKSFFQLKDLIFIVVCSVGMLVNVLCRGGFNDTDAIFMGVCLLLVVIHNIIRIVDKNEKLS